MGERVTGEWWYRSGCLRGRSQSRRRQGGRLRDAATGRPSHRCRLAAEEKPPYIIHEGLLLDCVSDTLFLVRTSSLNTIEFPLERLCLLLQGVYAVYQPAIRPDQVKALYYLKQKVARPMTELAREAVDDYLRLFGGPQEIIPAGERSARMEPAETADLRRP